MIHDLLGAAGVLALCIASSRSYAAAHRRRDYAAGDRKPVASPRAFAAVYLWIRVSTPVVGLGAFLMDHPVWLVVTRSPAQQYLGLLTAALGFALFVRARRALGEHYSPCYDVHLPHAIVQTGPYRRVRHPVYTANLLLLGGIALATGSLWMVLNLAVLAAYYLRSAVLEERALRQEHPDYAGYMLRTGRFLPAIRG